MNKLRRKELERAKKLLDKASSAVDEARTIVEVALGEEEEYFENIPENLQSSARYEKAEEAVTQLEDTLEKLETMFDDLNDSMESIEVACE